MSFRAQESDSVFRVCIAGAGFGGAILGRQLQLHNPRIKVTIFERAADVGDSETSTGLNLNPNGLAALKLHDPELERSLRAVGLPRQTMTSRSTTGKILYQVPIYQGGPDDLAQSIGLRIRWRDASTIVRSSCPGIKYNTQVVGHSVDKSKTRGGVSVSVKDTRDGSVREYSGFDLLVASDGRYSCIRQAITGEPKATLAGVCNFRVLVKDPFRGKLFNDLELIYNETPNLASLPESISSDPEVQYCFNGFPRFGVLGMPATETCPHESIYIFGNFPVKDQIPEVMKRADVLHALFAPSIGEPDAKTTFLLDVIDKQANNLHWARMQEIPFVFRDQSGCVLLLGDAAHAMVPSLGQGATVTIEGACLAAQEILHAVQLKEQKKLDSVNVPKLTRTIEESLLPRVRFISDTSLRACEHLRSGVTSLEEDVLDWTQERNSSQRPAFRSEMRKVWTNFVKSSSSPQKLNQLKLSKY